MESDYLSLLNTVDGIVWEADAKTFQFSFVSQKAGDLLGYPVQRWLEIPTFWKDHIHPEDRERTISYCERCVQQKKTHQLEYRMIAANGTIVYLHDNVSVIIENDEPVLLRGIMIDITEQKKTDGLIRDSEQRYRTFFEQNLAGIYRSTIKGVLINCNEAFAKMLKYESPNELLEINASDLYFSPSERNIFVIDILDQKKLYNYENVLKCKDGSPLYIIENISLGKDAVTGDEFLDGIVIDITQRKRTEDKLITTSNELQKALDQQVLSRKKIEESENRFRAIIEKSTEMITLTNEDGAILYASPSITKVFGYTLEELNRVSVFDFIHTEDIKGFVYERKKILQTPGTSFNSQIRVLSKDNKWIWCEATLTNMLLEPGVNALVSNFRDISEKKKVENQQEFDRHNLAALFNNTSDLMWSIDKNFKLITFNQPFFEVIRLFSGKELKKGDDVFLAVLSPEQFSRFKISYARAFAGEIFTEVEHIEVPFESLSEISYYPIRKGDEIIGTACHSRDITERKKTEENLRQSEKRFRQIVETAQEGIWIIDDDNKTTFVNKKMCEILGYTEEEMMGRTNLSFKTQEEQKRTLQQIERRKKGIKESHESSFITKNGRPIYTQVSTNAILREDGSYKGALAMMTDITQRKEEELLLKESIERYNYVTRATFDAIWDWDIVSNKVFWGEGFVDLFGKMEDDSDSDVEKVKKRIHPEEAEKLYASVATTLKGKDINWNYVHRYLKSDGSYAHVSNKALIVRDENGRATRVIGAMRDITEKKELENLLDKATNLARIGSWELDLEKGKTYWSPITKQIHEVEPDFMPALQTEISFCKEGESRFLITQKMESGIDKGIPWDVELQIITARGNEKWIRSIGEAEFANDKCIRVYGSLQDIDVRKRAELAATEVLEEKNTILESIGDAFFAVDKKWTVNYWNNHAEKMLGVSKNDILGHHLWEVFSESVDSESYRKYNQAIETGQKVHFEDYYESLDKWYAISGFPSENGLSVYFKDITERKLSEIQLNKLNESLQKRAEELVFQNAEKEKRAAEIIIANRKLALSNEELERFAYVTSHDLQEPLRMVSSFLQLLQKKYDAQLDETANKYINFAVDGANRMKILILDLLEYSRISSVKEDHSIVDLDQIAAKTLQTLRASIEASGASVMISKLPVVCGNELQLLQLFQNLVGNALKYKNDVQPVVQIGYTENDNEWEVFVKDNGIGIEAKYFDKIFIIFQRLHSRQQYHGTGIGLAICKKIVEMHGGRIWVASEKETGSVFYFTISKNQLSDDNVSKILCPGILQKPINQS